MQNNSFYDPVRYRDWRYPKASRNTSEDMDQENGGSTSEQMPESEESRPLLPEDDLDIEMSMTHHQLPNVERSVESEEFDTDFDDLPSRHFGPRYLCFLDPKSPHGFVTRKVSEWMESDKWDPNTEFVFLSYTRRQFCVTPLPNADFGLGTQIMEEDRATLLNYGIIAARSARKTAFWLDIECIRDTQGMASATSQSNDVYRICDIVRAAHSLAILVGPSIETKLNGRNAPVHSPDAMKMWLQEWGSRLWTLPEILLCSPEHKVTIYAVGSPSPPEQISKRNFATRAWKDGKLVRQLIDHYESSIHLTPLEFLDIAIECFSSRQTEKFTNGDMAYALMGLLRRQPRVIKSDTSFEAFARLSFANDSNALLERLLCMHPVQHDAPWYEMKDIWGVHLWNIEPRCQIAGIVDDETVTLDGAVGATIRWDKMRPVRFLKRKTLARTIAKFVLRSIPGWLLFSLVLTGTGVTLMKDAALGSFPRGLLIPGIILLIPSVAIFLSAPAMLLDIYRGKFWTTQAQFIGVEGLFDPGVAEEYLFGFNHGRLKWSTNGSPLSRHELKGGECVALPPVAQTRPKGAPADGTLFTLIDTFTLTVTSFYAKRPPSAVFICGQEGGMQRAVLCSYDWRSQTFTKETILRMKTLVLDRMSRVDRIRFALKRKG